jgi:hypothetical protein
MLLDSVHSSDYRIQPSKAEARGVPSTVLLAEASGL